MVGLGKRFGNAKPKNQKQHPNVHQFLFRVCDKTNFKALFVGLGTNFVQAFRVLSTYITILVEAIG